MGLYVRFCRLLRWRAVGWGPAMLNDLESLLLRQIETLDPNTPDSRQALYSRIRAILLKTLGTQEPPPDANQIHIELQKLEHAITRVEAQHAPDRKAQASPHVSYLAAILAAATVVIGILAFGLYALFNPGGIAISAGPNKLTQDAINRCWEDLSPRTVQFGDSFLLGWSYFTGATYFVIRKADVVNEYNSKPLTESDRLNRIEWQGSIFLRPKKFQTINAISGYKWHWQDGSETLGRNGYTCNLQKTTENWLFMSPPMWIAEQLKRPDILQVPLGWQMEQDDEIQFSHLYKAEQQQRADAAKSEADQKAAFDRKVREGTTRTKTIMQFIVPTTAGPMAVLLTDVSVEMNNQVAWFGGITNVSVYPLDTPYTVLRGCVLIQATPGVNTASGFQVCIPADQLRTEFSQKLMAALSAWREKFKDLGVPASAFGLAFK